MAPRRATYPLPLGEGFSCCHRVVTGTFYDEHRFNTFSQKGDKQLMKHAINWFEIPSNDFERAVTFYGTILDAPLRKEVLGGTPNGVFAYEQNEADEAIVTVFAACSVSSVHWLGFDE